VATTEPGILERLRAVHVCFERAGLDHAVGGALALAIYVYPPRGTADIDLNVTADPNRPDVVLSALPGEVKVDTAAAEAIRATGQVRLWWRSPTLDTPIDLFLPQHPTFHYLAVSRAEPADFDGTEIKVLTATDLMVFKMLYNRRRDWADIESLVRCGAGDTAEAGRWVAEFVGANDPRLATLQEIVEEALP
jgi:hypothetical protein